MSHKSKKTLSKTFTDSAAQAALDEKLLNVIEKFNFRLDELRCTKRRIARMDEHQVAHGDDWLPAWNSHQGIEHFQSKEAAAAQYEAWHDVVRRYDAHVARDLKTMKKILAQGANPNALEGHPLWMACSEGNLVAIRLLHDAGASLERRTFEPYCHYYGDPLEATWDCGANHVEAAKLLIDLGCQPRGIDVYLARQHMSYGVEKLLKDKGIREWIPPSRGCALEYGGL
jgi:hypothetical protein